MSITIFAPPIQLAHGAFVGFVIGFLFQKGTLSRFDTIVGQFLLRNFTLIKVLLTALIIGGIGMYSLRDTNAIIQMPIPSLSLLGAIIGGIIFGIGMVLFGYCPGTSIAAWAEGAHDAFYGILGVFVGSVLFELTYPWIATTIVTRFQTRETISSLLNVSPWIVLICITIITIFFFANLEKREL